MPRKASIDASGALHHIIRGIEGKSIFKDDADRQKLLDRLGTLVSESRTGCYVWIIRHRFIDIMTQRNDGANA
jgi:putative transposase